MLIVLHYHFTKFTLYDVVLVSDAHFYVVLEPVLFTENLGVSGNGILLMVESP